MKKKKPGDQDPKGTAEEAQNAAEAPEGTSSDETADVKAETPDNGKKSEKAAGKDDEKAGKEAEPESEQEPGKEKVISETEFFKLYLQQAMEELKKAKSETEEFKKQLENAQALSQRLQEKLTGLSDEYENYRRRTAAEKESLADEAVSKAVTPLLPALDSLERAMPYAEENPESFRQGVEMTFKQLTDGFKALQVEEIPADGAAFDPALHNAVMHFEDDALPENTVAEVFQKGYKIGDRVIRHAMVKVAN